eukprot:m.7787 g.7787  ORF g.7787 m.7787 type:complete len:211 (+) comp3774_c0_seq1:218-850(+)
MERFCNYHWRLGHNSSIDVGTHRYGYVFAGEVYDGFPNGWGVMYTHPHDVHSKVIFPTSMFPPNSVIYGVWVRGELCGKYISMDLHGQMMLLCDDEQPEFYATADRARMLSRPNDPQKDMLEFLPDDFTRCIAFFARMKATEAWQLAEKPWTRTRNHYNIYRRGQDIIKTMLLCAERIRVKGGGLVPLPVELWEIIISFTVTPNITTYPQ